MPDSELILVADIGGTNTRIALGDTAGRLHGLRVLKNSNIRDLQTLLKETIGGADGRVASAVLAVAGPVDGDEVRLTNHSWKISRSGLEEALGLRRLVLVNDFLAGAHAVPALLATDVIQIQKGEAGGASNILVCGPGTGFGAAALIDSGATKSGIASEAGHMVLGATSDEESELFRRVSHRGRPLVVEDVISGSGLVSLYSALSQTALTSEEIIASAQADNIAARKAVAVFMKVFGRIAGDLALAFNALGGVYIVGGIGRALAPMYAQSEFLESFCDHPPYADRLRRAPLHVVTHDQPGLLGALQIGIAKL